MGVWSCWVGADPVGWWVWELWWLGREGEVVMVVVCGSSAFVDTVWKLLLADFVVCVSSFLALLLRRSCG